jgi:hypothetical protein
VLVGRCWLTDAKEESIKFLFRSFQQGGDLILRSFYGDSNNESITMFHTLPQCPIIRCPAGQVNHQLWWMLKNKQPSANISKLDIQISIHFFILSVISLLIFICYMHPFFRMEWIESIQKMTPSDLGACPNGWPTSAILRWSACRCFHLCHCTNYRPCETLNGIYLVSSLIN